MRVANQNGVCCLEFRFWRHCITVNFFSNTCHFDGNIQTISISKTLMSIFYGVGAHSNTCVKIFVQVYFPIYEASTNGSRVFPFVLLISIFYQSLWLEEWMYWIELSPSEWSYIFRSLMQVVFIDDRNIFLGNKQLSTNTIDI